MMGGLSAMIPSFKTQKEKIIYLLGEYNINDNIGIPHKYIVEQLANDLDKGPDTCKANLAKLKSSSIIQRYKDEGNVCYKFTTAGYNNYIELKSQEESILSAEAGPKGDHKYFNDWFGIYYPDAIDQYQDAVDVNRS